MYNCTVGERLPEEPDEREEGVAVESEGGAAAGVGGLGIRERGELGAGEVVAVHGDEGRDRNGGGGGKRIQGGRYSSGESGFPRAWDA